jgi:hypothetical protein
LNASNTEVNHIRWVLQYRVRPSGAWTSYSSNTSNTTLTISTTSSLTTTFAITDAFDFRLRAYDRFYDLNNNGSLGDTDDFAESIAVLPFGKVSLMIGEDKVAIGKVWTNGTLDVGGDIYSNGVKVPTVFDVYPVGAIYMSTVSTSPATLFGGTWTALANQFLVASGGSFAAGTTGGASTHTHTSAAHTHTVAAHSHTSAAHTHTINSHTHTVPAHAHSVPAHTHGAGTLRALFAFWSTTSLIIQKVTGIAGWADNEYKTVAGNKGNSPGTNTEAVRVAGDTESGGGGTTGNSAELTSGGSGTLTTNSTTPGNTGTTALTTNSTTPGNTGSSSNLPPYLAVYMWRRTA